MVSFQCHACGDVVKKPKLDQHRTRCGSGFDCIDCSTTFNTPADYKGHTQCISEAEKYQKSLYKGPKTNPGSAPRNNYPPSMNGSAPSRQFGGGYGGRGRGGGGGGGWGRQRSVATGANDTPLGTPTRSSPVPTPAATESRPTPKGNDDSAKDTHSSVAAENTRDVAEKEKEKKRKSKAADVDEHTSKKVKIADSSATDPSSIPLPSSPVKVDSEVKSKKEKKEKKEKKAKKSDAEEQDDEARERKKRRKERKEAKSSGEDAVKSALAEEDAVEVNGQDSEIKVLSDEGKSKKSKKKRKEEEAGATEVESSEKSKKRKRQDAVNVDSHPTAQDCKAKKEKKTKRTSLGAVI